MVIGTLAIDGGLLHLVQRGGTWAGYLHSKGLTSMMFISSLQANITCQIGSQLERPLT